MRRVRLVPLAVLLAVTPAMISCWPFKKSRPKLAPPAPKPAPTQTAPAPQPLPPPPELPPKEETPQAPEEISRQPGKVPPPPAKKRPSPLGPPVQAPTPGPQLRPMLSPQQRQELERETNARIGRARRVLAAIHGRPLNRSQKTAVSQIETFILQAEQAKGDDLIRAGNLAERADVLAQDLMRSVR